MGMLIISNSLLCWLYYRWYRRKNTKA